MQWPESGTLDPKVYFQIGPQLSHFRRRHTMLEMHERAFLSERAVEFIDSSEKAGEFRISKRAQYVPLEHKIPFLIAKFGQGAQLDKGGHLWQKFQAVKEKRDRITHSRKSSELSVTATDATDALEVVRTIVTIVTCPPKTGPSSVLEFGPKERGVLWVRGYIPLSK
jgi:hypothetical protein